ncbi:MAG: fumarylacetoacetate hydrolase family protein [Chloroflexi bacterium]|nr:fumarylacetoacetate hydrolase family protein [Chloroflexota bacterium]
MRLVTYGYRGTIRTGAMLGDDRVVDLGRAAAATGGSLPDEMVALLRLGDAGLDAARAALRWAEQRPTGEHARLRDAGILFDLAEPGVRLLAPVQRPGKALAIGLNYRAHAAETGAQLPEHPIVFTKVDTSLSNPGDPVHVPKVSTRVDWEGELCFVIGRAAHRVPRAQALDYVAGYMNGNDVSVRDWQRHAATWTTGKGFDTHGPTGPWLVTRDEIPDPTRLQLRTYVNDVLKQDSSTGDLIFDVPALIEYISTAFTLRPGDIVFTGTPSGVGQARDPREWLQPGDTVRVSISGLGDLVNPVIAEP